MKQHKYYASISLCHKPAPGRFAQDASRQWSPFEPACLRPYCCNHYSLTHIYNPSYTVYSLAPTVYNRPFAAPVVDYDKRQNRCGTMFVRYVKETNTLSFGLRTCSFPMVCSSTRPNISKLWGHLSAPRKPPRSYVKFSTMPGFEPRIFCQGKEQPIH